MNHRVRYLGQLSFSLKINAQAHRHTDMHTTDRLLYVDH